MWNIKEEELSEFKITSRNRLDPDGATGFMIGAFIWSSIVMFMVIGTFVRFGWSYFSSPFEKTFLSIELILFSIQALALFIYLIPKVRFKFQKLQTLVILYCSFQLATIGFSLLLLPIWMESSTNTPTLIYIGLLLLGALFLHILTTIDTFKQAENGAFNMGGNSSSFFNKTKERFIIGAGIYAIALVIIIWLNNQYTLGTIGFYLVLTVILYAVAVASAEFQLLAYCRFKFSSFNTSWEEHQRKRSKYRNNGKNNKRKTTKKKLS
ncbi:hypothetical protein [Fictibacillus sp. FJAT-27399]|uniref:hypothetical protein n=1 Tax=Fictibacillus sp. FJAT-27399 TaxID=1729689 RepID=UPI0007817D69|nr:hypothetical protein [Fictibacillus sp. FJAT-27399]